MAAGELAIRRERSSKEVILWLSGEVDRATSTLLERELDASQADARPRVVDLTGVVFIDSCGLGCLAEALRRARGDGHSLSVRPGIPQRVSELGDGSQRRSGAPLPGLARSTEDYYFALAMACAIVDHQRPQ